MEILKKTEGLREDNLRTVLDCTYMKRKTRSAQFGAKIHPSIGTAFDWLMQRYTHVNAGDVVGGMMLAFFAQGDAGRAEWIRKSKGIIDDGVTEIAEAWNAGKNGELPPTLVEIAGVRPQNTTAQARKRSENASAS